MITVVWRGLGTNEQSESISDNVINKQTVPTTNARLVKQAISYDNVAAAEVQSTYFIAKSMSVHHIK